MAGPDPPDGLATSTGGAAAAQPGSSAPGATFGGFGLAPAVVVFAGNLVARGLGFLFPVVLANVLGRPEFAVAMFLVNTGFFAGELILTGFPTAMTRALAADGVVGSRRSWIIAAVVGGLPLLAISIALGAVLAIRGDAPVGLLSLVIVGLTIDAYYFALLRGLRRFGWLAIYRVGANSAQLLVIVALAVAGGPGMSLGAVIAVYSLIYLLPIVAIELIDGPGRRALRHEGGAADVAHRSSVDRARLWELTRFAIPALVSGTAYGAILGFDVFFVRIFAPLELADYAAARSLALPMLLVPFALSVVLMPQAAAATGAVAGRLLGRAVAIAGAAALLGWVAFIVAGPTVIDLVFPPAYGDAIEPLTVLVPAVATLGVYSILGGWLMGIGRPWTAAVCLATGACVTVAGHLLLTARLGAVGAGISMALGAATALVLVAVAAWRIIRSGGAASRPTVS